MPNFHFRLSWEVAGIDNQAVRPQKVNIKSLLDYYAAVRCLLKLKMTIGIS